MANQFQDNILEAIDILVNNRINNLQTDKTVTATILACNNALTGEYKVSYNGGYMSAFAQNGATYGTNVAVYVLVPEGDFTKTKMIVGMAQSGVSDDSNISFVSSALSNYNLLGKNSITPQNSFDSIGVSSYKKENYYMIYDRSDKDNSLVSIDDNELSYNIAQAEAVLIEASFLTRLPSIHQRVTTATYGVQFVLAFSDADKPEETKYFSYVLDNTNMTGNPMLFLNWNDQYMIYPVDAKHFLHVESIMFFAKDFVAEDDRLLDDINIYIKELEIFGLKTISAVNGEYKLSLSTPQGNLFNTISDTQEKEVLAKVVQTNTNISDATMFYWFKENNNITSSSEQYQMYGGAGWEWLKDKSVNYNFLTNGAENLAQENNYLCVAVYKETVILKEYFTLFNSAAEHTLTVTSSLGTRFSFDRGIPILTCAVDDKTDFTDTTDFTFAWSKIDKNNQTFIFNQTKEELEQEYSAAIAAGASYSEILALKNQITLLDGVDFTIGGNTLTYPAHSIDTLSTFKCAVYKKGLYIGSASVTLQNELVTIPTDYSIVIENGDQVFQYSESGVAPDSDRYAEPLEILPLSVIFYDQAGLEVNKDSYSVQWIVPLTDTMVSTPAEGMILNPATDKIELYAEKIFPLAIDSMYDYQSHNNQLQAIVTYGDTEYSKLSNLLFTKIGENGTNGTDVVAKIYETSPNTLLESERLALQLPSLTWNTSQDIGDKVLNFALYQRNSRLEIADSSVLWSVSGSKSGCFSVADGTINWKDSLAYPRVQIAKASITLEGQSYHAFYSFPTIQYHENTSYKVGIDKIQTIQSITYNADGRNPLYNQSQGAGIIGADEKYFEWTVFGGDQKDSNINGDFPGFQITKEEAGADVASKLYGSSLSRVYVIPNETYNGAHSNHNIRCRIYTSEQVYTSKGNWEVEIYIPVHMSLNTYGLQSLNDWDGVHLELNEEGNYILAPQIGAGSKDSSNRFTGVVMGTSQTYDADEESIGLLGYSKGAQSIFLDAKTGNATFGLPEQDDGFTEGRISLVPGGTSEIGSWKIGSRSLYNVIDGEIAKPYEDLDNNYCISIPHDKKGVLLSADPAYLSVKGKILEADDADYGSANTVVQKGDSFELQLDPNNPSIFTVYRHTNAPEEFCEVVTIDSKNVIVRANDNTPLSIMEEPNVWTTITPIEGGKYVIAEQTKDVWSFHSVNETGEYMASSIDELGEVLVWRREAKVGINNQGRFYTNALKDSSTALTIGSLGGFGSNALRNEYVGAVFEVGTGNNSDSLFKMFTDTKDIDNPNGTLYLSGATSTTDEHERPIQIHGRSIELYSGFKNTSKTTADKITISTDEAFIGHEKAYLSIPAEANYTNADGERVPSSLTLLSNSNMEINAKDYSFSLTSGAFSAILEDVEIEVANNFNASIDGDKVQNIGGDYKAYTTNFELLLDETNDNIKLGYKDEESGSFLRLKEFSPSLFQVYNGLEVINHNQGISLISHSAEGIELSAQSSFDSSLNGAQLRLTTQIGGNSDFALRSPHGTLNSTANLYSNNAGVQITPGLATPWAFFSSVIPGTASSIIADKDIRSNNGWMYASNFKFLGEGGLRWPTPQGDYVWDKPVFEGIWNQAYSTLPNNISTAKAAADAAQTTANTALTNASSAWQHAQSAHEALAEISRKLNNHKHYIPYGDAVTNIGFQNVTVDGEVVTRITSVTKNTFDTYGPTFT